MFMLVLSIVDVQHTLVRSILVCCCHIPYFWKHLECMVVKKENE